MSASDGTPLIPFETLNTAENIAGGLGDMFNLLAGNDFAYNLWEDDFRGDTLLAEYPAAATNGASAAVTFTEHNNHGFLDFITGTALNGRAGQGVGLQWTGDRGCLAEFLFTTPSSIADFKFECGWADSDAAAGMVLDKGNITGTGTDYAVLVYDTDDNGATDLQHAKGGTDVAVENATFILAVSTLYYVTLRIDVDNVRATIQGLTGTPSAKFTYANATADAGIEGATALTPWFFVQSRSDSASKTIPFRKWRMTEPAY